MIQSFADQATADVFADVRTKANRPFHAEWNVARRKLAQLDAVSRIDDLRSPPGNRFEALKRDRIGQYSIGVNDQYRVCFTWTDAGPEDVELVDYHD